MAFTTTKPVLMLQGGLGDSSNTVSYAPVCAGVSTQGTLQTASSGMSNTGYVLTSTGASSLPTWQAVTTTLNIADVDATPYVVGADDQFLNVDTSSLAITVQLPNGPATGRVFSIKDGYGDASTNNITVTTVGGLINIDGAASVAMNTDGESLSVIFTGTEYLIF